MEIIAKKMGLSEPSVLSKAKEIEKLIETKKSSALDLTVSLQCALSLHVAARMKGVNFDKALALKTSATRKTAYDRMLFTVEKLIDLEPSASVKDMCLKLGIAHLAKDAETLKSKFEAQTDIDDVNHPMYAVGAVWIIAKSQKISIEKSKILELARTKWVKLESVIEKMKKLHVVSISSPAGTKKTKKSSLQEIIENCSQNDVKDDSKNNDDLKEEDEDYDEWRERMIQDAKDEIKQEAKKAKLS